jgi:hypothetical protein
MIADLDLVLTALFVTAEISCPTTAQTRSEL